jgi:hypothetical protein
MMTDQINCQQKYLAPNGNGVWAELAKQGEKPTDEQKKSQETLKEVLLTSLQMQNLIVLTGCGTSHSVGGPAMSDLWVNAIGKKPTPLASWVAKKIKYDLTMSKPNIEDFLSLCDAYLQINDVTKVRKFVSECKKVILEQCSSFLDIRKLDAHKTFLHRLSRRRIRDPRLKIFTTNYDLCFERAAGDLGLVVVDGFSFTQPRYYEPRYFEYDIVRRSHASDDQGRYLEGVFQLYKLHGSVNWAHGQGLNIEEKQNPTPDEVCLIYPAGGKYHQSFLQPHLELLSQYFSALREPNTCLIVTGFGFNDDHLSEPILSAVRSNPHLRLIIADPFAADSISGNGTSSRYWKEFLALSGHGEDIWFINASFSDFARMIPDLKSLTPSDKLMKDIKAITGGK